MGGFCKNICYKEGIAQVVNPVGNKYEKYSYCSVCRIWLLQAQTLCPCCVRHLRHHSRNKTKKYD